MEERLTKEDRHKIAELLNISYTTLGLTLLDRALSDGTLTEEEWAQYQSYGIDALQIASLLQAYYSHKDGLTDPDERVIVVTGSEENIYKHKEELLKKFNIIILSEVEAIEILKKREFDDVRALI
jgi:aspartate/methionine/tyrosine aminotransferase